MSGIKGKSGAPGKPRKEGGGRKRSRVTIYKTRQMMVQRMTNDGEPCGEPFVGEVAAIISGDSFIIVSATETWTLSLMPVQKKKAKK